ncbi:hypothetical protein [Enterobacter ludwigii]|uniref:Uncharacterized protein n=1 Tax=Enterobacter ludwigii TaxID=299767 RepID=A0AAX3LJH7_9ENTR|nr:hypothetical protein [Enterobacter ludwigii]WCE16194.1 hypothetical protein PHA72_27100 [Enterobacter ludwigii]
MTPEIKQRIQAFRRALELAAGERASEPVPLAWHKELGSFPFGCCELASQGLVKYLRDHDKTLFPYVIAMQWNEEADIHGHVIVALDGEYIDLTIDQFEDYKDWIVAEPVESCGQIGSLLRKVRQLKGSITTRNVTLDVIPHEGHKLYGWLRATADNLLAASEQKRKPSRMPQLVSMDILPQYRAGTVAGASDKATNVSEQKNRQPMTHTGTITECYQPREVRLRETATQWVSECGLRFRKATGAAVGSGVWSANRLDLKSIREIQPAQKEIDLNETSNDE